MVKKLAIVILNYNKKKLIEQCLNSLVKSQWSLDDVQIIVVDNGSVDNSVEFIKEFIKSNSGVEIKLIENNQNLGFTGGNNVGIKYGIESGVDNIMLLNNDIIVKDDFWQPMIKYLDDNPKVGVIGPKIYFAPNFEFHRQRYSEDERGSVIWYAGGQIDWDNVYTSHRGVDEVDNGQYDEIEETDFVTGCCLMARRELFEELGLLDDKFFLYYEDSDFCLRAQKSGWQTVYFPESVIWHLNAGSSKSGGKLQDYYLTRNRMLFGMRWAPIRAKLSLIRESIKLLFTGRQWQKKGIRDFYLCRFGQGSWQ